MNSSDEDTLYTAKLPVIKKEPSLEKLQNSAIYQSIKQASGFKADCTSPDSRWSVLNMLSSRQVSLFFKANLIFFIKFFLLFFLEWLGTKTWIIFTKRKM